MSPLPQMKPKMCLIQLLSSSKTFLGLTLGDCGAINLSKNEGQEGERRVNGESVSVGLEF